MKYRNVTSFMLHYRLGTFYPVSRPAVTSQTHTIKVYLAIYTIMVYCYYYMTEKRKPTYDLEAFKAAFDSAEKLRVTGTAPRKARRRSDSAAPRSWRPSRPCSGRIFTSR